jgi:hypothetical protein
LREVRRFEEAITTHHGAAEIFRETANRHLEDIALRNLASDRTALAAQSKSQQQ